MRWCRFRRDGRTGFGIIDDADTVTVIAGSPFGNYAITGATHALGDVKLLAPVVPPTFYAAGVNYRGHVTHAASLRGEEPVFPEEPHAGYRAINALVGHGDPIVIPRDASELVQYEGELVAVIGRKCRDVPEDEALDYVFGYTIGNDVSERTWQKSDRTLWRAKNTDTFKPMGPWIVTDLDPDHLHVTIRLNDRVVGEYDVGTAIFGVARYLSAMSRYLTLAPGDVLWMGTDGATGNMKHGDVVAVEISEIGTLRNPVRREAATDGG